MADQDKNNEPTPESQAASGLSPTNAGWLKAIFGDTAAADIGKIIHRSKKIAITLSQDMVGDLATVHHVEIIGVPHGATIRDGEDMGAGIWRIVAPGDTPIIIDPSPENSGPVNLSLKVSGEEAAGGDVVSVMAGVRIYFPPKTPTNAELGLEPKVQPERPPELTPEPEPLESPDEPPSEPEVEAKPPANAERILKVNQRVRSVKLRPRTKQPREAKAQTEKPAAVAEDLPAAAASPAEVEKRTGTGTIVVRLGGAPEFGDPHYRISIDERPLAHGNVDWGLGLPALDAGVKAAVFWQTRSIDWDFKEALPSRLSIACEITGHGGLLVDFIEVDGFQIAGNGPFAMPSGGWQDVPAVDGHRLWNGELVFDIATAYAAPTDTGTDAPRQPLIIRLSANDLANDSMLAELRAFRGYLRGEVGLETVSGWAAAFAENDGIKRWNDLKALGPDGLEFDFDPRAQPLIIRLSDSDIADGAVLAELAKLGHYLRGEITDDPSIADWAATFGGLNGDEEKWSDLVVLGPDGAAVPLPGIPQPLIMRIGAEDMANPAVTSQLIQLRRHLRGERDSNTDKISSSLAGLESPEGKWNDLVVLDPDGAPVSFDENEDDDNDDHDDDAPTADAGGGRKFSASEVGEALARLESTAPRSTTERDRDAGARLKSGFFAEQLDRAFAAAGISPLEPAIAPVSQFNSVSRTDGEQLRHGFFASILEIGMQKIRSGIDAVTATEPPPIIETVAVTEPDPPSNPVLAISRPAALSVRRGFFTAQLKTALDCLRASRLDAVTSAKTALPETVASTVPWQVGAQLSSDFFNTVIDRAIGRLDRSTPSPAS